MVKIRKGGGMRLETTLQGCSVYYDISHSGNPSASTVLLLHGWGCDSTIFSFIASSLAEDMNVVTLDFPGHGKSHEPPETWGVPDYGKMVLQLLEELGISSVHIVAHSFGGRVAIWLASQHPSLVQKLVITGGAGIKKPTSLRQQKRTNRFKRFNRILDSLKALPAMTDTVEKWQTKLRNRYGSADYVKLSEGMRKTFVKIISEDLLPMLGDIHAPTLLIWGSGDTETPLWMGQQMEQCIADAGLIVFEGRSHFAFLEEWQRFVLIIKQFLADGKD